MSRTVNWLLRILGFAWIGVLTFVIYPPPAGADLAVTAAGYTVAAIGLAGWMFLEYWPHARWRRVPATARAAAGMPAPGQTAMPPAPGKRAHWTPAALAVISAAAGCVAVASFGGGIALIIFGFLAVMFAIGDASVAVGLTVMAVNLLASVVTGLALGSGVGPMLGYPAVVLSGLLMGRGRRAWRMQAEQSAALLAQREKLAAERRRADLLDERARIAREIHDVLAHSLGALSIQIQAARSVLADHQDIAKASELLAGAQRMAAEGLTETRRAVHALRSEPLPVDQELARTATTYAQRYGVPASFATDGDPRPLPPEATLALLRVAQESLVNAAKHAPGQPVTLRLGYAADEAVLTVINERTHTAPAPATPNAVATADAGYGLTGMRERLRILNGSLTAGPDDGHWIVTARLPLPLPTPQPEPTPPPGTGRAGTMAP